MNFKLRSKYKYFLGSLGLVLALIFGIVTSAPDNKLHLIFCDVGQGDAILAVKGDNQILIDGGPSDKALSCLSEHMPFWDRDLELVVLTHPEYDHITGLVSVIERYGVRQIVSNSLLTESGVFDKFRTGVVKKNIPAYSPKEGDRIKVGDLALKILFPQEKLGDEIVWKTNDSPQVLGLTTYTGNFNQTVIVSELDYGSFKALLTGDIGVDQEKEIEAELEKVDVLKVAHHGSKYSTSAEFLDLIQPSLAVISVGANNNYGHPTSEVLNRLKNLEIKILRTDVNGEIELVSDGNSWKAR